MSKILILFAHPALEKSRVNKRLVDQIESIENVTFHDLYEEYPDFYIDIKREQKLLTENDIIIFHHPFYWYSIPALLKQWEDLVLEHNWAYGSKGNALVGKKLIQVITTGGSSQAYKKNSFNRFTVREFLIPIEQTAVLCGMIYLPPYLIQGTHKLTGTEIETNAVEYHQYLSDLSQERIDFNDLNKYETTNDYLEKLISDKNA
jgi:glutathione-regulated potassium-efflux system ancillary protein KefG